VKKIFPVLPALLLALSTFALDGATASADPLLKKGAELDGTLQQTLSSKTTANGTTFTLTEKDTFFHHNPALKGATIDGHVENVSPAGPTHKATMSVVFDDVKMPDGTTYPLDARVTSMSVFEPHTHHIRDAGLVLGGFVAGHMAAGKHHGGLAGAAAGVALASSLKSDIVVKSGTLVKMKLNSDLVPATN
jgi:hypothetical protein